ncbi:hypothetical protein GpartN1_g5412.t1 [Galdieria partita]|uniref:DUF427 domain-containing protein n=1 Tax=Galdieria partita TaxID=83374 RepID=A0A9C7Q125_9RHOD|nr:hypothetical protein GpartN1_g5412.t1 [Galdieria partita]
MRLNTIAFQCTSVIGSKRVNLTTLLNQVRRCRTNLESSKDMNGMEETMEPQMSQFGSKRRRFFERNRVQRLRQQSQVATATWMRTVLAKGTDFEILDSKVYFREEDVDWSLLHQCEKIRQFNPIGMATFYNICVKRGNYNHLKKAAAWKFGELKGEWKPLERRVAFWKGVEISVTRIKEERNE